MSKFFYFTALALLTLTVPVRGQTFSVERMTVNGRINPLGISAADISFGWTATSDSRGTTQQAYEIRVGTSAGLEDVWTSGKVNSDRQVDVTLPSSIALAPATRYFWQVRLWDQAGRAGDWSEAAGFETGLLTESDWSNADWITRPIQIVNLADWSNYTATVVFTLQSQAFGVFFRSSTNGQNAYMWQISVTGSSPALKTHKRVSGAYTVLATVDLAPFGFSNAGLTGTTNTLQVEVSGANITTKLNGITIDTRSDTSFARGVVGFRTYGTEAGWVHQVQVVNPDGGTLINPNFSLGQNGFTGGVLSNNLLTVSGDTDAVYANLASSLPLLRGKFVATNTVVAARVYASAQGLYEVTVNGQKAGNQFLAPGWTDYDTRIQSQTYDITALVQQGTNVIGAALGDGWFRGKVGIGWTRVYGSRLAFVAKIKVTYADGSSNWFASNPGWKASDGPYVTGDLQDGETYNANREQPGWDTTPFDDSQWLAVDTVSNASARLVPQPDEPIRQVAMLTARSRTQVLPGKWIYDLGQNMVGVARIVLSGKRGETVTFRHGEELYRTGAQIGQLYTANLRTAKATDTYTFAADGTVTYQPTFTQHGFRYLEITGTTNPPAATNVQGVVLSSDMPGNGDLVISNSLLNQLVSNIRWGQRGNFLSIPTDTPARDERLGWTGDINVFAPTAARYQDTRAFLSKWMADVRDARKADGNIPAVVPQPGTEFDATGVGWSDAFITIPYNVWRAFGDARILRENWAAMKTFYQFASNSAAADGDLLEQGRSSWFSGDWLSLEPGWNRLEEHKVIGTAYFAEDTRMMAEMAMVMGETNLAANLTALVPQIRAAFVNAYRASDGSIYQGTETVYAMALGMDMIADPAQREQTAARFIEKLAARNYHLSTGFLGTPWLLPALSRIGRDDLAMQLLLTDTYPSWGFPITMGATTMWERWNSIQPDGQFGDVSMNSFNHYAYGAVGDWMFGNLGGLQALAPGYKQSRIAPLIGQGSLTSARCAQDTAFGPLATEWSIVGGTVTLKVQIPFNTTARVCLPTLRTNIAALAIQESGTTIWTNGAATGSVSNVVFAGTESTGSLISIVWDVGSGTYQFTWPIAPAPDGLRAAAGNGQVRLSWNPQAGATGYNVKRAGVSGGPYATLASGVVQTNYTDSAVFNDINYYYVVSALQQDVESDNSLEVAAMPRFTQVLFLDNFATSANSYDVNSQYSLGRQSGALAPLQYRQGWGSLFAATIPGAVADESSQGFRTQVNNGSPANTLYLAGGSAAYNIACVSPECNFNTNAGPGNYLSLRFNVDPITGAAGTSADWAAITFGAGDNAAFGASGSGARGQSIIKTGVSFLGIFFRDNGKYGLFANGVQVGGDGTYSPAPAATTTHPIEIRIYGLGDGNAFDGTGDARVECYADGNPTPFLSYTNVGGFTDNYVTFEGYGGGSSFSTHAIDNFQVAIDVAPVGSSLGTNSISLSGSVATVSVLGIPNHTYVLQTATNLNGPWWALATNSTGALGNIVFSDPAATNSQQFYRTVLP